MQDDNSMEVEAPTTGEETPMEAEPPSKTGPMDLHVAPPGPPNAHLVRVIENSGLLFCNLRGVVIMSPTESCKNKIGYFLTRGSFEWLILRFQKEECLSAAAP